MHNSYFHIVMVIMGDECLLSQQGSQLAGCTVCACAERIGEDVRKRGGGGGKVSGDAENVLKDGESAKETESVAGKKALPPYPS